MVVNSLAAVKAGGTCLVDDLLEVPIVAVAQNLGKSRLDQYSLPASLVRRIRSKGEMRPLVISLASFLDLMRLVMGGSGSQRVTSRSGEYHHYTNNPKADGKIGKTVVQIR